MTRRVVRASNSDWVSIEITSAMTAAARKRCAGYNFDATKSQAEVMRDCYIQGVLDGAGIQEKLIERARQDSTVQ